MHRRTLIVVLTLGLTGAGQSAAEEMERSPRAGDVTGALDPALARAIAKRLRPGSLVLQLCRADACGSQRWTGEQWTWQWDHGQYTVMRVQRARVERNEILVRREVLLAGRTGDTGQPGLEPGPCGAALFDWCERPGLDCPSDTALLDGSSAYLLDPRSGRWTLLLHLIQRTAPPASLALGPEEMARVRDCAARVHGMPDWSKGARPAIVAWGRRQERRQGWVLIAALADDGRIVDARPEWVRAGERFRIYSLTGAVGVLHSRRPPLERPPFEESSTAVIKLGGRLALPDGTYLASSRRGNALPRPVERLTEKELEPPRAQARRLAAMKLRRIDRLVFEAAVRVDLEGDGTMEVLVSARAEERRSGEGSVRRDYSFVFIAAGNASATATASVVVDDLHGWAEEEHADRLTHVLDLDGDGTMELVIVSTHFEEVLVDIYRLRSGRWVRVARRGIGV